MKIKTLELYEYAAPFSLAFHSPQKRRSNAEAVLIVLTFDNGIQGYGESTPRNYVTGETCRSVCEVIQKCFAPVLFSIDLRDVDDVRNCLDLIEKESRRMQFPLSHSALGAVDIALLDALGKAMGQPLSHFLGPIKREKIRYAMSIPFLPVETIRTLLPKINGFKFQSLKIIMGPDCDANADRLRQIRDLFDQGMEIRIEANGKWTSEQAVDNVSRLKPFGIAAVEQPVARGNLAGLKAVKALGVPVVVDESICSFSDVVELIENEACDIINIKISKCGGLIKSRKIAEYAHERNIACQLGTHVGETDILSQAGLSFAMTAPNLTCFEDASFLLFDEGKKGTRKLDGSSSRNAAHGLGVELRREVLEKVLTMNA
ncbi:MAG: enolase C-terminal domain-like protein [Smithellaceae bacterium]|nr:enolase C-terminal domain-like protein [Smithellaceae bacterium]